ncbi:hypothetical protein KSP35_14650 [Aquihabitans sp. G128]|uniref:Ig-like domain-containing protein n=1 Tax=Aquihabitans sp. G128 TaxID=2849779 RepID=UPI001C235975|nr:Ig-like domain-containing protein [Aquihabitans sp. G128]QXC59621.1 hypothetical protein KSP35_14650 [Aquihabitans sp. G128]
MADGAEIEVGDTISLTATVYSRSPGSSPNDGPDPLKLDLPVTGPVTSAALTTTYVNPLAYNGKGSVGPIAPVGPFAYKFDSNSSPKGLFQPGDGAYVAMTIKVRATAPGEITVPRFKVSGYDATPTGSSFDCGIDVGFHWTVDDVDAPTSGADTATTDATYGLDTLDDANGGAHAVRIDVLANDDDPEVAGGPGDPAQVRVKDWQPGSAKGGTVSCGTGPQKGETTFAEMSVGPCTYTPPTGGQTGVDSFGYVLRSKSGLEVFTKVYVTLRPNTAPQGGPVQFAANDEAVGVVFDLKPSANSVDGDPVTCIQDVPSVSNGAGSAQVQSNCTVTWSSNDTATQKSGTFAYRICDTHPLLGVGAHGALATPVAGYDQGSPDDLSATTSRRCSDAEASVLVTPVNDTFIAPVVGVTDVDTLDAGYAGEGIGAYSVDIPVFANDLDPNGPAPSDPTSGVVIPTVNGIQGVDPAAGTAVRLDARTIRFTAASGFSGPTSFDYVACEDPAQQTPDYPAEDDPNTPQLEGLPFCGKGKVALFVVPNAAPEAVDDAVVTDSSTPVVDLDVKANDFDAQGETLECTPGALVATPAGLVASASVDAQCRVDLVPVAGAEGVADLDYAVCDVHALVHPTNPAPAYGADGRQPGDLANRCATATVHATITSPPVAAPDPDDDDPAPVCVDDEITVGQDEAATVDVLANDTDLDLGGDPSPLEAAAAGIDGQQGVTTEGGVAEPNDDQSAVSYTPAAGFAGTDTFLYSAVDTAGKGCTAEVTVHVTFDDEAAPTTPTVPGSGVGGAGDGAGTGSSNGTGTLPRTGTEPAPLVQLALAFAACGTGLVLAARRNRRRLA